MTIPGKLYGGDSVGERVSEVVAGEQSWTRTERSLEYSKHLKSMDKLMKNW